MNLRLSLLTSGVIGSLLVTTGLTTPEDVAETWVLQTRRSSWMPRDVDYVLHLTRQDGVWEGTAAVDLVMSGRTIYPATDIEITDDAVRFDLHMPESGRTLQFSGERSEGVMEGEIRWHDHKAVLQRDDFTAHLRPVRYFDGAAASDDRLPTTDPGSVGLSTALLDRIIIAAEEARSDGLVVLCDGQRVVDRTFGHAREPLPLMGLTAALTEPLGVVSEADYARIEAALFAPLGITETYWSSPSRLWLTPLDLARVGQVVMDGGLWAGQRLMPAAPTADGLLDAGYGWKPRKDGEEVIGYGLHHSQGEHLLVYPQARLIVARLIETRSDNAYDRRHQDRDGFETLPRLADRLAMEKLRPWSERWPADGE